jgi:subfamily B ATP-binding cassette protein HlyB/CyaB
MDEKDLRGFFGRISLFSIYSQEELGDLARLVELRPIKAGEVIFEQGAPGDRFYVVYAGKVRILRMEGQKEINLGVRTSGDFFGEAALITDHPRSATARAAEDGLLLCLDRQAFEQYLFSRPQLREQFDKFLRNTSIHTFLKSFTDLSAIPPKELQELVLRLMPEFFKEGEVVFRQGAAPDKFYLVERGKLKVVRWEGTRQEIINFLREGDFFGEKALIEETVRHADVICLTDCHLFSLTKEDFRELVRRSPKLQQVMRDRIESYLLDRPPIPYAEVIKQELAALKEAKLPQEAPREEPPPRKEPGFFRKVSSLYYQHLGFPFIVQQDQTTCGTTCIMMIARYYGKEISSSRLRELAHVDISGASLANLASAAEKLGFSTRGMKLDYDTLRSSKLPCIVHWQGYHYIVVYRMDERRVWVADPALGLRKYSREEFDKSWTGIALILEPTEAFERVQEDGSAFRNFFQFVRPYKLILGEVFVASLLLNIFGLASPIFTQNIVDKVLLHKNVSMLNVMLIGMLVVLIFRILTMIVRQYLIIHTSMKIDLRMLVLFYKHMLALPLGYFKVRKIGDFITRFGENMKIRNFLTNTALTIVLDAILIVVYLSLMFYYNLEMTALVLLFIPVLTLMTLLFTPVLKRLNMDSFAARAESESHLIESINAIDTVKAMNVEYPTRWKWENKFIKSLNIDFRLYNTAMYFQSIGDFAGALASTLVLWYGAHKVMGGVLSVGELMAFMALMGSVITPVNRIITAWDEIQQTLISVDRLNDIFSARTEFPESPDEPAGITLDTPRGEIAFEDVYFRYGGEEDPYILSGVSVKIPAGKTFAIVGRSGSGKTTLVRLLARLYDLTEGRILLDGVDIRSLDLSQLRKVVGFVLQESFIFNGTIRENISMGDSEESMEKVMEAAKLANAHDFVSALPLGYETRVGESGLQLSGGQRQRIAIARALYARPKVIVFDEATSSLDTESEQAIQKNLRVMFQDKTAIIIAHRLSTVRNADQIVVLDNGEIVEQGSHEELMARKGLYHYLNHQQLNL